MNLQENIRRILREEGFIPLPIKRRVSPEDIEEAFDYALERMGGSMNNPDSIIYKEKGTTLKIFAKFVIDEMVTYIEQDYFNDNNRIYFSDNDEDYEIYHEKIRKPLLRHYGKRIKEKYDEVMLSNNGEMIQESIRRILREMSDDSYDIQDEDNLFLQSLPRPLKRRITHEDMKWIDNRIDDYIRVVTHKVGYGLFKSMVLEGVINEYVTVFKLNEFSDEQNEWGFFEYESEESKKAFDLFSKLKPFLENKYGKRIRQGWEQKMR
jgi:hypothetical protein